ncbi:MAG: DUF917 domain-containing protein [Pseudomonadota bacterium]
MSPTTTDYHTDAASGTNLGGQDLQDVMNGAAFLSVGGGGPRNFGQKLLDALDGKSVSVVAASQVPDDAWVVCSAYLGSPDAAQALKHPTFNSLKRSIEALQKSSGITVDYVVPGEMGAVNTVAPFLAASDMGVPLIDADGCGRAVPILAATSFGGDSLLIPRHGAAVANDADDLDNYQSAVFSAGNIEQIQIAAGVVLGSPAYGKLGAVALWLMTGAELKKLAVVGGVSRAQAVGKALREAQAGGGDPLAALQQTLTAVGMPNRVLFNGSTLNATGVKVATRDIHDHGTLTFQVTDNPGEVATVYTFNENILMYSNRQTSPVLLSPDMLGWMRADGSTLDNSELQARYEQGDLGELYAIGIEAVQPIGVPGLPDRTPFRDAPNIRAAMTKILGMAGYSGEYTHFKA